MVSQNSLARALGILSLSFFLLAVGITVSGYLWSESQRILLVTTIASVLFMAAGIITSLFWRQHLTQLYLEHPKDMLETPAFLHLYEYLTKYVNDIILLIDQDLKIVIANDRAFRSYGYSRDELLQMNVRDLRTPKTRSTLEADLKRVEEQNGLVFETMHQRKDGTTFPVEISSRPIEIEKKKYYQSIIRDITERKQRDVEYQTILRTSIDGFWITDMQGHFLDVNDAYCRMMGYSRDELLKMRIHDVEALEKPEETAKRIQKIVKTGGDRFETKHRCKDGKIVDIEVSVKYSKEMGERLYVFLRDITERKKAEEALRESERRFRAIAESTPDAIITIDNHGKINFWNRAAKQIFGYNEGEVLGKPVQILLPERFRNNDKKGMEEFFETGESPLIGKVFELIYLKKDGSEFLGEFSRFGWKMGGQSFICAIIRDITERKQRDVEYQTILRTSIDGFWTTDMQGHFLDVNDAYCRMMGYSRDELLKMRIHDVEALEKPEETAKRIQKIVKTGGDRFETKHRCKDGKIVDIEVSVKYSKEMGERLYVFLRDITERKLAEEASRESEERFRSVVQTASEAILIADSSGKITFWNQASEKVYGYSAEEVIGKPFTIVLPKRLYEYQTNYLKRTLNGKPEKLGENLEGIGVRKDGSEFPYEGSISTWETKDGTFYTAIFHDISDRKKMEEELLKNRKIESIGTLAGGIAHDFNNILTAILGNISLARMNTSTNNLEKSIGRLTEAEKACLRAKDLTQQLLTFSRGGAPVKKISSCAELLKESAGFALRGSKCQCESSIPGDLLAVEVDEGQISQVIHNLIINADQAMPQGGTIQVSAENIEVRKPHALPLPDGKYVKISIKDHGIGISEAHISKIFDPYFTTKQKGSGLGLATSYSIVKNHGGYITVKSHLGDGTTFTFYLPASTREVPKMRPMEGVPFSGRGKVLVLDDDEMIRDLLSSMLSSFGYEVEAVTDGSEAIEVYKKAREEGCPFGAVIVDLTIPGGMGGKETIKKLIEIDPEIKAIVSSGYSNDPIMADCRKYGFSGIIAKPYKVEEISKILKEVIQR
jgi:PAS domain S-box-containing protein